MSNNAICGQAGAVKNGTNAVADIGSWELTLAREPMDVPQFGTAREKILCGPYEWSGSFEGNWYMTTANQQLALQDALKNGATVALRLYVDADTYYSGTAYISSVAVSTPHDGLVSVTFSYIGTGTLTLTV